MSSTHRRPTFIVLLAFVFALAAPPASSGEDDLEFARQLAKARQERYARKIYEAILEDDTRTQADKDGAWYGLALLTKERALRATADPDATLAEILSLFEQAVEDIEDFAASDPENRHARQARLDAGTIRLAFVQWVYENWDDPEWAESRGFDPCDLHDAAKRMAQGALRHFDALRVHEKGARLTPLQELATYYHVVTQYYRALAEPPCSPKQMEYLEQAGRDLEAFIMSRDGQLLAVYAQDIYGLVWWEQGKCADDAPTRLACYAKAAEWFETCIYTEGDSPDFLRVIASGYLHLARMAIDAARLEERDFPADARKHLETMLKRHPTLGETENGIRALLAWADLECNQGDEAKAIVLAKDASDHARKAGMAYLEHLSNRKLRDCVSGGCGGSSANAVCPDMVARVAEDLFLAGQYRDAIGAFRRVITATPDTSKAFVEYRWRAWQRMAQSYRQLGDRLGEALAYEPIHEAWMLGFIPCIEGRTDDPNAMRAGYERRYAESAIKSVAGRSGSPVFAALHRSVRDAFIREYPVHLTLIDGEWNLAIDLWVDGLQQRDAGDSRWCESLLKAQRHFINIQRNPRATYCDLAWVYDLRIHFELGQYAAALRVAEAAWRRWQTPPSDGAPGTVDGARGRRADAGAALAYWQARSLLRLGRYADVIARIGAYHKDWPNSHVRYRSLADDLLVQAHVSQEEFAAARRVLRRLAERDPEYERLTLLHLLLRDPGYR